MWARLSGEDDVKDDEENIYEEIAIDLIICIIYAVSSISTQAYCKNDQSLPGGFGCS